MSPKTRHLAGCPECDALQHVPPLQAGAAAHCVRCGVELFRCQPASLDRALAFLVAAAVLFVSANVQPLMELDARGMRTTTTIFGTAVALHEHGMSSVALLVLATTIVVPATQLAAMLAMLVPLRLGIVPPWLAATFRIEFALRTWVMVDVFMLGALVSLVKLKQIATVYPDLGLYGVAFYMMARAAAMQAYEPHEVWRRVNQLRAAGGAGTESEARA
jgi:paraquat-inducible protein A